MILIDLQKEIDKISHKILLDKLLAIDFSKNAIIWYVSYLAEPHFPVEVINRVSKVANISCGVLKGSILDLLLFLIEVIGIGQDLECDLCLYADDSCWLFQLNSVTVIKKNSQPKTSPISVIVLQVYISEKTKQNQFCLVLNVIWLLEELDIRYNEIKIKHYKHANYLRCVLDKTGSGKTMALRVIEK